MTRADDAEDIERKTIAALRGERPRRRQRHLNLGRVRRHADDRGP